MTEETVPPIPDQPAITADPAPQRPAIEQNRLPAWLYGLGFLILAAAIFYVWRYPTVPAETIQSVNEIHAVNDKVAAAGEKIAAVDQKVAGVDGRLTQVADRPIPVPDLDKLTARLDALEARLPDQTQSASRLDVLSGRIEALSGHDQTNLDVLKQQLDKDLDTLKQQLDKNTSRISALEKTASSLGTVSARVDRGARVQAVGAALAAGQPLGDIPGAPPALSRFAHSAPPTEAELRMTFPAVERAALAAAQTGIDNAPFIDRVWDKTQGLLTVRQGNDLVLGNQSAAALSRAHTALDAGDLVAAANAVATLKGEALQATDGWLAEAKALIDARAALADMAAHA